MTKRAVFGRSTLMVSLLALGVWMMTSAVAGQNAGGVSDPVAQQSQTVFIGDHGVRVDRNQQMTIRPVLRFADRSVIPATGTQLVRTREGVFATVHTSELSQGAAVTFWWVFFNNPKQCATRPCTPADLMNPAVEGSIVNGGGKIIGADEAATFGGYRKVGDQTGIFIGPGLLEPMRGEIHLVMRTHGPAILDDPAVLREQLSLFNGGCPPNECANIQASIHEP